MAAVEEDAVEVVEVEVDQLMPPRQLQLLHSKYIKK